MILLYSFSLSRKTEEPVWFFFDFSMISLISRLLFLFFHHRQRRDIRKNNRERAETIIAPIEPKSMRLMMIELIAQMIKLFPISSTVGSYLYGKILFLSQMEKQGSDKAFRKINIYILLD